MIKLSQLSCRRGEFKLFAPLDLTVAAGQYIELTGPNGAGKTTLLRTLAGIYQQYDGAFEVEDFLFQGHRIGLDGLLNPLENLTWHAALAGTVVQDEQLREALRRVDMLNYALTPVQAMSQGQQRRIAMARWLLGDARVWLLDEPVTALDSAAQTLLLEMLQSHCAADGIVVCATHTPLDLPGKQSLQLSAVTQ
ncbi:MAG: heme ABC exporter ATP-binding protein CcmA [Pseudomonadota bacterium]